MANGNEGSTPALGDAQARKLLEAPPADTLKGVRDRAILATLLYHGIRREELCGLRVKDLHSRQGVMHFRVKGKRSKIRFVPVNAAAQRMIEDYLALTGNRSAAEGALFRTVKNNRTGRLDRHLDPASVYQNIVRKYGLETGLIAEVRGLCVHSLRAPAATAVFRPSAKCTFAACPSAVSRLFLEYLVKAFDAGKLEFFSSLESLRDRQAFLC